MADTYVQVTNTGQTVFTLPFSSNYLLKSHVKVYKGRDLLAGTQTSTLVDGTDYTFTSATQITLTTGLASGEELTIQRETPKDSQLSPWNDGSNLTSEALNNADLQCLYFTQEQGDLNALAATKAIASETASNTATTNVSTLTASQVNKDGSVAMTGNLQLGTNKITGVGDPTSAQDAVTKAYLERTGSIQSAQIQDGTLVNNDINASAAIAQSKLDIADATTLASGYMSAADKTKLNGIESGATADQTNAEIRAAVEAASDSNVFTDADHTKLDGIEASATADQTASEIKTLLASDKLTTDHIADDAVTSDQLATNSVGQAAIAADGVGTAEIEDGAVTNDKIAANTIHAQNKLVAESITSGQIADGNITTDKIGANQVTEIKLAISNEGTDGQYLQKQSGNTGGLTWATVSGGGSVGGATGIDFNDDVKIRFGDTTNPDLEIYHDGSHSYIQEDGTGQLIIRSWTPTIKAKYSPSSDAAYLGEDAIICMPDAEVKLYYDGAGPKFETKSYGAEITGELTFDSDGDYKIKIPDERKIRFGDDTDLEIYFNGTNSKITNSTGTLYIEGTTEIWNSDGSETLAKFTANGAVELYYDGGTYSDPKFSTTANGISVTGNYIGTDWIKIQADNKGFASGEHDDLTISHTGEHANINNSTGNLRLQCNNFRVNSQDNGESLLSADKDGSVKLYFDGGTYSDPKLETTANGVLVTGRLETSSYIQVAGDPTDGVNQGVEISQSGYIETCNTEDNYYLWKGYKQGSGGGNGTLTSSIKVDGTAAFAASVDIGGAIDENVFAITDTASPSLDPDQGTIQTWTLDTGSISGTRTPSDSISNGQSMLLMINDGDGSDSITFPSMTWVGGSAPTLATSGYTCIELWKVSGTLYGSHVGDVA